MIRRLLLAAIQSGSDDTCTCQLRFGSCCRARAVHAARYQPLIVVAFTLGQMLLCCGNSHRQVPSTARPRSSPHGGTRTTQPGRRNPGRN